MKKLISLLIAVYFICSFTACRNFEKTSNIISEIEAIEIVEDGFGEDYSCSSNGLAEVDGTSYYVIDLKQNMGSYLTHITYYFVSTDGFQIIEGGYNEDGEPELFD